MDTRLRGYDTFAGGLFLANGFVELNGGGGGLHAEPGLQGGFAALKGAQRLDAVARGDVGLHQQAIGIFPAVVLLQNGLAMADDRFPLLLIGVPLGQPVGGVQVAGAQALSFFVGPVFVVLCLQVVAFVEGNGRFIRPNRLPHILLIKLVAYGDVLLKDGRI